MVGRAAWDLQVGKIIPSSLAVQVPAVQAFDQATDGGKLADLARSKKLPIAHLSVCLHNYPAWYMLRHA